MRIFYPGSGSVGSPELRLDQLEAIYRIVHELTLPGRSRSVLVGAGMGSGKTVVSVEVVIKTKPKRCLIVGVRDACNQWSKAFKEQGVKQPLLKIDKTVIGKDNMMKLLDGDPGLFYVGLEMLRAQDWEQVVSETYPIHPDIKAFYGDEIGDFTTPTVSSVQKHTYADMAPVDLLISDESHKHANQKSASIKTVRDIPARAKIALSGTFFGNKFDNAWSLCTWLWGKKVIGTKGGFEAKYCVKIPVMSKDGRKQLKTPGGFPLSKVTGELNPGEYVETLPCYVFIATPIGPVPKSEIVKVQLDPEQMRQYVEMETQSLTWVPTSISSVRAPLIADMPVTQQQRLRTAALGAMTMIPSPSEGVSDKITFARNCKSSTLNVAHAILHRPDWIGRKVLILTHSKPFAEETARRMGQKYRVALKTGGVSGNQWEADKASFMSDAADSIQYLVAVISAVGTATDGLQANCSRVLWLSEDNNNINNIQGENRVWRDGVDIANYQSVKIIQKGTIAAGVLTKNNQHKTSVLDSVAGTK